MTVKRLLAPLMVLAMAACDETPVSLPEATTVTMTASDIRLVVGDMAPVPAQVLDQEGRVLEDVDPVFTSDLPSVAFVDASGMVRAIAPGTATITASYGGATATAKVTVVRNERGFVQTLEVLADSLNVDVRMGVQAVALRAFNGLGQPVCPAVTVSSSDASVATASSAGGCRVEVRPLFPGVTTITVSADGVSDSFRVRVSSAGATAFFSARPTAAQLFAGNTVSYTAKVLDEAGAGVAGRTVNFDVSAGALSASSAVTGPDGTATVQWTLPTNLREQGRTHAITFRTQLPNGQVSERTEQVFVEAAALTSISFFQYGYYTGGNLTPIDPAVPVSASTYRYFDFAVSGQDRYGNTSSGGSLVFSATGPAFLACGNSGYFISDTLRGGCLYSYNTGTTTVTATSGSVSRSFTVNFTG